MVEGQAFTQFIQYLFKHSILQVTQPEQLELDIEAFIWNAFQID